MSLTLNCNDRSERVCIQTKKVFDACQKQLTLTKVPIAVSNISPPNPMLPLTYIGAKSSSAYATVNNLVVKPLECGELARYTGTIVIPLLVYYKDANNVNGVGTSTLSLPFDIVLCLPQSSIMPYFIDAVVSASSSIGNYIGTSVVNGNLVYNFIIDICILLILKVVMEVELIVAAYGYAAIPECTDFGEKVCDGFFSLPLYP